MEQEFNNQVKYELESAYLYLSMAAWFDGQGLAGMANWMRAQVQEEVTHAMRFVKHLTERGARVELKALGKPQAEWQSAQAAFEAAYAHEQFITGRINLLMKLALEQNDFAAQTLLHWFVDEQVEEENSTLAIAQKLRLVAGDGRGLLMLDTELAARQFVLAPELAAFYAQGAAAGA
jgi:ferritin